jgi:hypothetical protein
MIDDLYDDMPAPLLSIEKEPDGTRVLEVDTYTATARARGDWHAEEHAHPGGACDALSREPACSCCDSRLSEAARKADLAESLDLGPHPYSLELAQRVRGMLGESVRLPGVTLLADAIEEALWFAARDLRAGREVHLHHIGDLLVSDEGHGPALGVMPDRDLLRRSAVGELGV